MQLLDLVVIVPIEQPDRIAVSPQEHEEQRRAVTKSCVGCSPMRISARRPSSSMAMWQPIRSLTLVRRALRRA
jgi:hypothetical protein